MVKQGWRILKHPNSLAARVLKGCYFRHCSFFEARKNSSASYVWSSLIWGRGLLDKGLRWRVGDGKSVKIYGDRWIPRPTEFKILSPPTLAMNATVDTLFSPSGGWNIELIHNNFLTDDAKSILRIPIALGTSPDSLLWHYETSGRYTVGSGYWLDCNLNRSPCSSNPSPLRAWWRSFWKLQIPLKIKIFFWRACYNWIPTNFNIARRGIQTDGICVACKASLETTMHALWECKKLNHVRNEWYHLQPVVRRNPASFLDFVIDLFSVASEKDKELFCVLVWRVWGCRNVVLHRASIADKSEIFGWSQNFLHEFHRPLQGKQQVHNVATPIRMQWIPPVMSDTKMNCAVSFGRNGKRVVIGGVVRDSVGEVLACCSQSFGPNLCTKTSKLIAFQRGLQFGVDCGLFPSMLELDDVHFIDWVNSGNHFDSVFGAILRDILQLSASFHGLMFSHVNALANNAAKGLSNFVLGRFEDMFWMEEFPSCISNVIEAEKPV
ncbi:hypothetical protein Dsin_024225 [Dipteronia sinensis]|uniref:Reverse transcriptase zinc-binding domain-containing protein n=1 Tax=Dipteronia sinensis TaxID=43782 RepID=A0AAE0DVN8_9ROSI|nr:hypothetical protein Dsin_024225 [Dipteronia sinensis]